MKQPKILDAMSEEEMEPKHDPYKCGYNQVRKDDGLDPFDRERNSRPFEKIRAANQNDGNWDKLDMEAQELKDGKKRAKIPSLRKNKGY
jgi:hypothetical protein